MSERLAAEELIRQLADLVAERVAEKLRNPQPVDGGEQKPLFVDARASGLPAKTFRRAIRTGELPGSRVGREYFAKASDVEAYVVRHAAKNTKARDKPNAFETDPFDRALVEGRLRRLPAGRRR